MATATLPAPTASSTKPAPSSSKSFWPRELIFASPNPSTLPGGRQLDAAPMCPCNDCWQYGSHALAPHRPPKAPKTVQPKAAKQSSKGSPLRFLKKSNASKESVASDMRPLRQSITLASAASSVYGAEN